MAPRSHFVAEARFRTLQCSHAVENHKTNVRLCRGAWPNRRSCLHLATALFFWRDLCALWRYLATHLQEESARGNGRSACRNGSGLAGRPTRYLGVYRAEHFEVAAILTLARASQTIKIQNGARTQNEEVIARKKNRHTLSGKQDRAHDCSCAWHLPVRLRLQSSCIPDFRLHTSLVGIR